MQVNIRPATIEDTTTIYRFTCELEEMKFEEDEFARCFESNLPRENYYHLVAEVEGRVVGFISCYGQIVLHHCGMEYEVQELYVEPKFRSLKIGRQLLQVIEAVIGEYKSLKLCSHLRRKDAHRFYLDNGFEQTGYRFVKQR